MEQLSVKKLLELHHVDRVTATRMKLLVKCKFCKKAMIQHTSNDSYWHLIYLSEGLKYGDIYT